MPVIILRASHPAPTFAVTILTLLLAIAFGVPPGNTVVIVVAVFLNQIAVGLSNDIVDVSRDHRAGRTDKPLATGVVSMPTAWTLVFTASALSLLMSALIDPRVWAWQAVFLFSGFAYNAGLKATVFSALPYATGFAALPALVSSGTAPPGWPDWWVMLVGASLGVSAHFANVLPDGESDRAEGIRGLPQRVSTMVTAAVLVSLTTLSSLILVWQGGGSALWVTLPAGACAVTVSGAGAALALRTPTTAWPFRLSMVAALFISLGLIGALQSG
jgi:4-hydroxybenzoate polyprenyltransferase